MANPPATNLWVAGVPLPVLFSLHGNQGSGVVSAVTVQRINCTSRAAIGPVAPATRSSVVYVRPPVDRYGFLWLTSRPATKGTCQMLSVTLADGTSHSAYFRFL